VSRRIAGEFLMPKTWSGKSNFDYIGSVENGTDISYGKRYKVRVSTQHYAALRKHFINKVVPVGTSRTDAPRGSLGWWLQANVSRTAIASYVAPILVLEGYAKPEGKHNIRITK
jgi:hypothetical protein